MVDKSIKIIQLSDSHLFCSKEQTFLDVPPYFHLERVIQRIKNESPDCLFATGDLSHDGTPQSYEFFSDMISTLKIKTFWIPGNHDDFNVMGKVFSKNRYLIYQKHFLIGRWQFICVETNVKNSDHGHIPNTEIDYISQCVQNTKANTVLLMHHHPLPVGTPLIDQFVIDNGADFLNKLKYYNQIKLIICGHTHGDYSMCANSRLSIECCPASSLQWKKNTSEMDTINCPGYKIYWFDNDFFSSRGELLG